MIEKDLLWHRKCTSEKQLVALIRKAAIKLNWDPEIVVSLVLQQGDAWNSPEFGYQYTWWGNEVDLYMYSREKVR